MKTQNRVLGCLSVILAELNTLIKTKAEFLLFLFAFKVQQLMLNLKNRKKS